MEAVTQATLLEALRKALEAAPDESGAMTTVELAEAMACGEDVVRKRLKRLLAANQAECVRVQRTRIDGQAATVAAYKLKG